MFYGKANGLMDRHTKSEFIFTLDTDWAPQFVLDSALGMLAEHGLAATVFCTGEYVFPSDVRVEAALHPNFMPDSTQGSDPDEVLGNLKAVWPKARGSRSHRLFWHSGLRSVLLRHGIMYDCSTLLPLQPLAAPANAGGLLHCSIWWSDNLHLLHKYPLNQFDLPGMDSPGLKILVFHPIHIFLNTASSKDARNLKKAIAHLPTAKLEDLEPLRNQGTGVGTMFLKALEYISKTQEESMTLEDAVASFQ